jgi:hypothetical protein
MAIAQHPARMAKLQLLKPREPLSCRQYWTACAGDHLGEHNGLGERELQISTPERSIAGVASSLPSEMTP